MTNARDYFLENYLPTTSSMERELWFRSNEEAQRFVEIMKSYGQEIVDECEGEIPWDVYDDWKNISDRLKKDIRSIHY